MTCKIIELSKLDGASLNQFILDLNRGDELYIAGGDSRELLNAVLEQYKIYVCMPNVMFDICEPFAHHINDALMEDFTESWQWGYLYKTKPSIIRSNIVVEYREDMMVIYRDHTLNKASYAVSGKNNHSEISRDINWKDGSLSEVIAKSINTPKVPHPRNRNYLRYFQRVKRDWRHPIGKPKTVIHILVEETVLRDKVTSRTILGRFIDQPKSYDYPDEKLVLQ